MAGHSHNKTCEIRIEGMTCSSCVESVEGMLRDQQGIYSVNVALLAGRGVVEYDSTLWSPEKLVQDISDIGFESSLITTVETVTFRIYGMSCSSCTSAIESGFSTVPGIFSAVVILSMETCTVCYDRALIGPREMVEFIEGMGFNAMLVNKDDTTQLQSLTRAKEVIEWRSRFLWSTVFAFPVFFISMIGMRIPVVHSFLSLRVFNSIYLGDILQLMITTPAQFWVGLKFYRSAYKSLKHGSATMDVLVVLGTSAAYFYSVFTMIYAAFITGHQYRPFLFFETSTMLLMFVSLGRYLENRAKGRTSAALTDLMSLSPSMATIYTDPSTCKYEKRIATELVQVGDIVKLVPGDRVPADGVVVNGSSSIDESAVTGEATPVFKKVGDSVIGGTVNGLGTFDMTVTRAGKDSALSQIVRLVEEAQTSKAPVQAFVDRVASYFVPTILSLAFFTLLVWALISSVLNDESLPDMFRKHGASKFAVCLQICISVIVFACPCALGLATPTAIMVGTGTGAKNGILIKGGKALEASKGIKRIVLDKTGTITIGKLSVVGLHWVPHVASHRLSVIQEELYALDGGLADTCADGTTDRRKVLCMVSAIETRSEHPLAQAIAVYGTVLSAKNLPETFVEQFESIPGEGVKASVKCDDGKYIIFVGSARFIAQSTTLSIPPSLSNYAAQESTLGRTVVFVSILGAGATVPLPILGVSLADEPKPSSLHAIRSLHDMGIEISMMTGDSRATALAVAEQVDLPPEKVWSEMSPAGKAAKIMELIQDHGDDIAMVGDGINDSPALAAATLGIALSSGTSVAIEAADIVLMRSDLLDVVAALHLSRQIFHVIRRNLIWACVYNILGMPLAMGVFLPFGLYLHPMVASAAMAFSSVSVVMSSLTLAWWKRPTNCVMRNDLLEEGLCDAGSGKGRKGIFEVLESVKRILSKKGNEGYTLLEMA